MESLSIDMPDPGNEKQMMVLMTSSPNATSHPYKTKAFCSI